jgi:flagellar biosynthesis/type III secretory pathway protein FliH
MREMIENNLKICKIDKNVTKGLHPDPSEYIRQRTAQNLVNNHSTSSLL